MSIYNHWPRNESFEDGYKDAEHGHKDYEKYDPYDGEDKREYARGYDAQERDRRQEREERYQEEERERDEELRRHREYQQEQIEEEAYYEQQQDPGPEQQQEPLYPEPPTSDIESKEQKTENKKIKNENT